MKRLRQLHISTSKDDGGTDRYSVRIAAQMQARGDSVVYACRSRSFTEAQCKAKGIATRPLRVHNSGDIAAAVKIAALAVKERAEVIHVHRRSDFVMAALGVSIARPVFRLWNLPRPALVLHSHVMRPLGAPAKISGWFFRSAADAALAVSRAGREFLINKHTLAPDFVRVLLNGISLSDYATPDDSRAPLWRRERRREWNIPETAFVLGMVGRLGQKGQWDLLSVVPDLLTVRPNLHIVLIGPETKPGDTERYRQRAKELGICDRVTITGPREDIAAAMTSFDLFVHLPREEAFGLVLVEAMASGLPLVVSQVGGCAEVAQENVTALFVPAGDADALKSVLKSALGPDSDALRQRLGAAGPDVAARFSLERQTESLHEIYRELCHA